MLTVVIIANPWRRHELLLTNNASLGSSSLLCWCPRPT